MIYLYNYLNRKYVCGSINLKFIISIAKHSSTSLFVILLASTSFFAHGQAYSGGSNVTLYGILDSGLGYTKRQSAPDMKEVTPYAQTGSRWGLKGSEDLGGGLMANFQLESGFNTDVGNFQQGGRVFGRWSYVGLKGNFGDIRFGRQWTASMQLAAEMDPFGGSHRAAGMQSTFGVEGFREDNAIVYRSPIVGGFDAIIGYSFNVDGLNASGATEQRARSFGGGYRIGPTYLRAAYESIDSPVKGEKKQTNWVIAGIYDFGFGKLHGAYGRGRHERSATTSYQSSNSLEMGIADPVTGAITKGPSLASDDNSEYMVGFSIPVGLGRVYGTFQNRNDKASTNMDLKISSLFYMYSLSKRTNLYIIVSDNDGKNGLNGRDFVQTAAGIRHFF